MKKIIAIGLGVLALSQCLTGCDLSSGQNSPIQNEQQSLANSENSEYSDSVNSEQSYSENESATNDEKYSFQEVDFEVNDICFFFPGSDTGFFSYNHKTGLTNSDGKVIVEPIYEKITSPNEGYCLMENSEGQIFLADENGKIIKEIVSELNLSIEKSSFHDTYMYEQFNNGYAFLHIEDGENNTACIDTSGNIVFETPLKTLSPFYSGVSVGEDRHKPYISGIDTEGNILWTRHTNKFPKENDIYPRITDGLIVYLDYDSKLYGAVDISGNQVLECVYEELTFAGDGLIGVYKYGNWGYMDYNGNMVIEPKFSEARQFINEQAIVKIENQYRVIDTKGNVLFNLGDYSCTHFDNGLYSVTDRNTALQRILNPDGSEIFTLSFKGNDDFGNGQGLSYTGGSVFNTHSNNNGTKTYKYFKLIKQ